MTQYKNMFFFSIPIVNQIGKCMVAFSFAPGWDMLSFFFYKLGQS